MMYITKVTLINIRCFSKLIIEFEQNVSSIVVAGDNGDGKSALLRSIAMGLCDESSANALLRDLQGDLVKKGKEKEGGRIEIGLKSSRGEEFEIITNVDSLEEFERIRQELYVYNGRKRTELSQNKFPWEKIFVAAYGAGLRTQGSDDINYYVPVDAVYPLFIYDVELQNPELVIRRLIDRAPRRRAQTLEELTGLLKDLLELKSSDKIHLTSKGIEIQGRWGTIELGALGDGYRATLTWVLDLISWWLLYKERGSFQDITGIVLVDELEKHLHPRWQIDILSLLRKAFPKIQFIVTTHSPLIISGSSGVPVHTLNRGEHKTYSVEGWLAEDVYREIMGLVSTRPARERNEIAELQTLHLNKLKQKLSPSESRRLLRLQKELKERLPPDDPVIVTTKLRNLMKKF
jgi:predicted ATP-binding protein involved in virulence